MSRNESETSSLSKNWELNQYELNRIPHEIIHDDTEIAISPQILQNELLCPICLDILKKTMTTKECLHRFCQECIITALRSGNKECPTCRKKLASKRSLRPDPNFDGIIAKIYPNREEYDAMHERVLEKLKFKKVLSNINQKSMSRHNRLMTKNSEEGTSSNRPDDEENSMDIDSQTPVTSTKALKTSKRAVQPERNNNHNSDADSDVESRASTEQSSSMHTENNLDEVEVVLKPHPFKEFNLTMKRFIKTTSNATVTHLSKYLWTRFTLEPLSQASSPASASSSKSSNIQNGGGTVPTSSAVQSTSNASNSNSEISDFQIFFSSNEAKLSSFQLLNQDFTLDQVIDKHWKQDKALELFYFNQKQNQQSATSTTKADENSNSNPEANNVNGAHSSMSSGSSSTSSTTSNNKNP